MDRFTYSLRPIVSHIYYMKKHSGGTVRADLPSRQRLMGDDGRDDQQRRRILQAAGYTVPHREHRFGGPQSRCL